MKDIVVIGLHGKLLQQHLLFSFIFRGNEYRLFVGLGDNFVS